MNRTHIYDAIDRERDFQIAKYGNHDRTVAAWILILEAELNEAKEGWINNTGEIGDQEAIKEILQVISVGVGCLENHGVIER
jgi:NTP pyrophosphatase (non-canonical NTP hydrolase)